MRGTARGAARMKARRRMRMERGKRKGIEESLEGVRSRFEDLVAVGVASSLVGRPERGIEWKEASNRGGATA